MDHAGLTARRHGRLIADCSVDRSALGDPLGRLACDDVESHDLEIEVDERRSVSTLIHSTLIQMTGRYGYLPRIWGGNATCVCMSGRRGRPLAVVAEQWKTPQPIDEFGTQIGSIGDSLHFHYVSQRSPQDVLDEYRAAAERGATAP